MNDFEYVDKIFCELAEKEEAFGQNALDHNERIIVTVWHTVGLISNGGLENFFVWEGANPSVADCFEEIDMSDLAQIIRKFFSLFSIINYKNFSSAERHDYIEANYKKVQNEIDALNSKIQKILDSLVADVKVAVFIREIKKTKGAGEK